MQNTLAERAIQTFDGVARQIFGGDIYPDANACFAYNHECDYLPLCNIFKGEVNDQVQRVIDSFFQEYKPRVEEKGEESSETE